MSDSFDLSSSLDDHKSKGSVKDLEEMLAIEKQKAALQSQVSDVFFFLYIEWYRHFRLWAKFNLNFSAPNKWVTLCRLNECDAAPIAIYSFVYLLLYLHNQFVVVSLTICYCRIFYQLCLIFVSDIGIQRPLLGKMHGQTWKQTGFQNRNVHE